MSDKSQETTEAVKQTVQDAVNGLKIFATNPVGGLPEFYKGLGEKRSLGVGIAFGIFFVVCFVFGFGNLFQVFAMSTNSDETPFFQVAFFGALLVISIVGSSFVTRLLFRGSGSISGDVFIAGTALLPTSFLILLIGLLGAGNLEILIVLGILAITYTILMIYTGCNKISRISESVAALAVAIMIVLSTWLFKVLVIAQLT
ncbi:hypothetical protein PN462_11410 [Spirulina sp. CS-785/01]|uniref:hypothetical protein n=1 Tax=Spirulina sp. CS-785/01 TaxID=3021716 RepID=UPI00232AF8BD|nr:hypothetical protein [Spirulina sp. CS-785/01]MDB9313708.1 hypothetical protein [Spirulina sp. CS-785/01]